MTINVLTNRYGIARTGVNSKEEILTKLNVGTATFGKLFTRTVDGDLYAQPLIVAGLSIKKKRRNVVYLATSRNMVYAFDADDPTAHLPIWSRSLGPAAPRDAIVPGYLNFAGEVGVTSTPVIRRNGNRGTIYVVAKTIDPADPEHPVFSYHLHALDIVTGKHVRHAAPIAAQVMNEAGEGLTLDPKLNLNRPALLLLGGVLYLAFGSHGDVGEFYGWILAYDADDLTQIAAYNTAPDWGQGGVWQSGTGLAGDEDGHVYAVVGNGESRRHDGGPARPSPDVVVAPAYGNALLKLKLVPQEGGGRRFEVVDWFTASDVFELNDSDNDFIGGPVLFDAPTGERGKVELLLGGGKDGKFYLADRNRMGGWAAIDNPAILQAEKLCAYHIHGAPVVWTGSDKRIRAFVWSEKDFLKCFGLDGTAFGRKPLSTSDYGFPQDENRMPGGILALSWNGEDDGSAIVWASHPTRDDAMNKTVSGTLRAYDAMDLNNELWTSDLDAEGNDRVGSLAKFCPPVVANGKVYVSTFSRELAVYGLFEGTALKKRGDDVGIFELRNIGNVQKSGSYACSKYDLRITGAGIGSAKDEFLFANVDRNLVQGEVSVTAKVEGISAPSYPAARAGVMIRRSFDGAERFASVIITNANQALFLRRDAVAAAVRQDGPVDITLPIFVRLAARDKAGAPGTVEFTGSVSKDGETWHVISAMADIQMDAVAGIDVKVGLVATAQTGPTIDRSAFQAHAAFTRVEVP